MWGGFQALRGGGVWPGLGVSARGSREGFLRDLNALRLDASANSMFRGYCCRGIDLRSVLTGFRELNGVGTYLVGVAHIRLYASAGSLMYALQNTPRSCWTCGLWACCS